MMRLMLTVRTPQASRDLLVTVHPLVKLQDLIAYLRLPAGRLAVDGREVDPATTIAQAQVRDGSFIDAWTGGGPCQVAQPVSIARPGTPALMVLAGPMAGSSRTVPEGDMALGRDAPITLADDQIGDHQLNLRMIVSPSASSPGSALPDVSAVISQPGVPGGTLVADERQPRSRALEPGESVVVRPGEFIKAGRSTLAVGTAPAADAVLELRPDSRLRYSRSPRPWRPSIPPPDGEPSPPREPAKPSFPWILLAAPAVVGVVIALLLRQAEYLAFIALSPVMSGGNYLAERRRISKTHREQVAEYQRQLDRYQASLAAARRAEAARRREIHPDPAMALLTAIGPSRQLWERQVSDGDFLALRVGTGTTPWQRQDATAAPATKGQLTDAPVVLSLSGYGVIGLTGQPADTRALARGLLLSLAVMHSPADVSVTVLTGPGTARDWGWIRWLPHARPADASDRLVRLGNDQASIGDWLTELSTSIESRSQGAGARRQGPVSVVVVDGARQLTSDQLDLATLLVSGPAAGMYFLCLDSDRARMPSQCQAIVRLETGAGRGIGYVEAPGFDHNQPVDVGLVSAPVCELAARAMAPIRDSQARDVQDALPSSVRLLDLCQLEPPTPDRIRARWAASGGQGGGAGRDTRALLGWRDSGPFALDLADGPHLLVGGTTGSGKSELLLALVASLATVNRPDAMNFALIDYKGGAAFAGCKSLPHTVGVLTDLDEFMVNRALTSLRAELQLRKKLLAEAGVDEIERYWEKLPGPSSQHDSPDHGSPDHGSPGHGADPLPRLVIVVDEFAVLAEQLPAQLKSLVDIGRQGRSLGIHLVLATQRPTGAVTADLQANMNLRIALRVTSRQDSVDVITTADAEAIPTNCLGRAFARLGGGPPIAFQTACVRGSRPTPAPSQPQLSVLPLDWATLGYCQPSEPEPGPRPSEPTDLSLLVEAITAAAELDGCPCLRLPWRPPLAELITLDQASRLADSEQPGGQLAFGVTDRPAAQEQIQARLDLAKGGHLLVGGVPGSGRTTLLRTLAGSVCAQLPGQAHLYVIDGGGGGLAPLAELPQCGAVVTLGEPERLSRLLARLNADRERRARLLAQAGHAHLAEYNQARPENTLPYLMVLVDRYDAFVTAYEDLDGGRLVSSLQLLVRDGLAAGIRVVATGDRSLLSGRLGGMVKDKMALAMAEASDYALVGTRPGARPANMPPGRALRGPDGDLLQVATLSQDGKTPSENQALRELAARTTAPADPPFPIGRLPSVISYDQARKLPASGDGLFIGVGRDDLAGVHADTRTLLVVGQRGSGRSTALAVQARAAAEAGRPVILVTPRMSTLPGALDHAARLHLLSSDQNAVDQLVAALDHQALIMVDDAELLVDTPLGDALAARCRQLYDSDHIVIAATTMQEAQAQAYRSGLIGELGKARCGLILEPAAHTDGMPLVARLPATSLAPGQRLRGVLVAGGSVETVQVPELPPGKAIARTPAKAAELPERPTKPAETAIDRIPADVSMLSVHPQQGTSQAEPVIVPQEPASELQYVLALAARLRTLEQPRLGTSARSRVLASVWLLMSFVGVAYVATGAGLIAGIVGSLLVVTGFAFTRVLG